MAEVVVLVHGIRDFALWQTNVRATLEKEGFKTEATNYGRLNLIQFLLPFSYFRKKVGETVWKQLRIIKQNNEGSPLSIIAHSFGTYIVAHLMQENFDIKFHRVIFCGSVVRYGFPFEQFQDRFSQPILNEVGTRDVWPAMAESVTTGYGSAGTYGFRRPLVRDRWHNGAGHGFFLDASFCKKYWIPFLAEGKIIEGAKEPEAPRAWLRALSIFKIKYILVALALIVVGWEGYKLWGRYELFVERDLHQADEATNEETKSRQQLRQSWTEFACKSDLMALAVDLGPGHIRVAPPAIDAWHALGTVMRTHGYQIRSDDTDGYHCRPGETHPTSLHGYGIAVDVNFETNPFKLTPDNRSLRYSNKPTQDERAQEVKLGTADTDMTSAMIADVSKIATRNGQGVFKWGGQWDGRKDPMHFEIALSPQDLKVGIDPATIARTRATSRPGATNP